MEFLCDYKNKKVAYQNLLYIFIYQNVTQCLECNCGGACSGHIDFGNVYSVGAYSVGLNQWRIQPPPCGGVNPQKIDRGVIGYSEKVFDIARGKNFLDAQRRHYFANSILYYFLALKTFTDSDRCGGGRRKFS